MFFVSTPYLAINIIMKKDVLTNDKDSLLILMSKSII